MDSRAKIIKLYEQYKKNIPVRDYFIFLRNYIQEKNFDKYYKKIADEYIASTYIKELNIKTAVSAYLYFYALNVLGFKTPYISTSYYTYDSSYEYDTDTMYDSGTSGERVSLPVFKKILAFVYNWNLEVWNLITLTRLIADFCEVDFVKITDIKIEYSETRFNTFVVRVPKTYYSEMLEVLFRMSADTVNIMAFNLFNLPVGMKIELELYEVTP